MALPSSRYFLWAERLRHRPGAVRGALMAPEAVAAIARPAAVSQLANPAGGEVQRIDDPRALERLTNQNGFMGFEYVEG